MIRELEPPSLDEGFFDVERIPFVREYPEGGVAGTVVALAALGDGSVTDALIPLLRATPQASPSLVYAWEPNSGAARLQTLRASIDAAGVAAGRPVDFAVCSHPGGRPICWCRPPLPAMVIAFAERHRIDLRISKLIGASATDRAMARALGMKGGDPPT